MSVKTFFTSIPVCLCGIGVVSSILLICTATVFTESLPIQSDTAVADSQTVREGGSGEEVGTGQVLLPDEQESDTQAFTTKLTITLDSSVDSGAVGDRVTNNKSFKFRVSSPTAFPTDNFDFVSVYKYNLVESLRTPVSCADSVIPTQRFITNPFVVGNGYRWSGFIGATPANQSTSIITNANPFTTVHDGPHCFIAAYRPGTGVFGSPITVYATHSDPFEIIIDTTRPPVTVIEPVTGQIYAFTNETVTVKTRNNVTAGNCTDSTSTASGWSNYTPDGTTVSFSGSGRCFIFTDIAGNTKAAHTNARVSGPAIVDYDTNNNNLIDIDGTNAEGLAKLNAMRYDLNGNGVPDSSTNIAAYRAAFPGTFTTGVITGCPSTCIGYELRKSLDLDTDGDGSTWVGTVNFPIGDSDDTYYNGGKGWIPIGNTYTAIFDGNGYTIDNLFVRRGTGDDQPAGLFREIGTGGIVRNLGLRDIAVRTPGDAGGIAALNYGTIQTSFVTGENFGGNSGLIVSKNYGTIAHSYGRGIVGAGGHGTTAGGIAGNRGLNNVGTIKNSWTATTVTIGATSAAKGGIVSSGTTTITNSYFDKTVYGTTTDPNGKTTTELQSPTGYTGIYSTWNDDNLDGVGGADAPWDFSTNSQYPLLTFGGHQLERHLPRASSIIAASDDAEVSLTWETPHVLGVTGWQFTYKTQNAADWESWADVPSSTASTRSHTVGLLTNGTTYVFKVRAKGIRATTGVESTVAVATPNTAIFAVDFDANDNNLIDITTLEQLNAIRYDLDGNGIPNGSVADKAVYYNAFKTSRVGFFCDTCVGYELRRSLDFDTNGNGKTWTGTESNPTGDSADAYYNSGKGWIPIDTYIAIFDGNGYTIDNLFIKREAGDSGEAGLFKGIGLGRVVRNLGLKDILVRTHGNAGGIASDNHGTIQTSFVTGSTYGTTSGLITARNYGVIRDSYSKGTVGAVGTGAVVGGIAGNRSTTGGTIKNSWTATAVTQTGGVQGGISGSGTGTITNSYFDKTVYGTTTDPNGKTTTELQSPTGYTGIYATWDDDYLDEDGVGDTPWDFSVNKEYPLLTFGGHQLERQSPFVASVIPTPDDTQVTLTWTAGAADDVTGWEFTYKTQAAGSWESWAAVPGSTGSTRSHTVASLTNGTAYLFKIRAVGGPESAEIIATPAAGIPATDFDANDNNLIDITTLRQLNVMRYDLDGNGVPDSGTSAANALLYYTAFRTSQVGFFCESCVGYELLNDLDLNDNDPADRTDDTYHNSGSGFEPIGSAANPFAATFDGNGFLIKNLSIARTSTNYVGLFGYLGTTGVLTEVGLRDVSVSAGTHVGSLVGYVAGTVRASYTTGSVSGSSTVGGLVGESIGTIIASYTTASAAATGATVGGLVGSSTGGEVTDSYATGAVIGGSTGIGGFIGSTSGTTVTTSYFDTETSGQSDSAGGVGKTTSELQSPIGYTGIYGTWDDGDIDGDSVSDAPWNFGTTSEYPMLTYGGHLTQTQRSSDLAVHAFIVTPGNTQVTLTWSPRSILGISGWEFDYKTHPTGSWAGWADVPSSHARTITHTITSLTNGTTYLIRVRAKGSGATRGTPAETVAQPNDPLVAVNFDSNDNNLIEITTLEQLNAMRYDLDGNGLPDAGTSTGDTLSYYMAYITSRPGFFCSDCTGYELMNNLHFNTGGGSRGDDTYYNSGSGWEPIGSFVNQFTATFDGNGFLLRGLSINRSTTGIGFFGAISTSAVVKNVALRGAAVTGGQYTGILVGANSGLVKNSYTTGTVTGGDSTGGLVGYNVGTITTTYSTARVTAGADNKVGGLVGHLNDAAAVVLNSYAAGSVTGSGSDVGGLVGATVANATVTASYWDTDTSGQSDSAGGVGKMTSELQSPIDYTGIYSTWDDEDIDGVTGADAPWNFGTTSEYPALSLGGQQVDAQRPPDFTLDLDGSDTFVARQDLLGAYLYLAEGIGPSQLRGYTHDKDQATAQDTANAMIRLIDGSITGVNPPLDLDGSGTAVARQDILGAYLYTAEGIGPSQLRGYTHDKGQATAQATANAMIIEINRLIELIQ